MNIEEHYKTLAPKLTNWLVATGSSYAEACDLVQNTFLKLWKMRDSLDLVRNPGAYGALLMRNLCIDRIRRLTPSETLPDEIPGQEPPDEELIQKERLNLLFRSMDTLPDSQRKLLSLHVLQGKSYDEIAAETGLSPLNIRVQVSLARKKLKSHEDH